MVHGMISNNSLPSIGYAMNAQVNGKISLPVAPSSLIYSHLKHVSGVPAAEGSQAININKLNILDVLIEQMNRIKKTTVAAVNNHAEHKVDAMIDSFRIQVQQANTAPPKPYTLAPTSETGLLFKLTL